MLRHSTRVICALLFLTTAGHAQPSTSRGQISVAQVRAMLELFVLRPEVMQVVERRVAQWDEPARLASTARRVDEAAARAARRRPPAYPGAFAPEGGDAPCDQKEASLGGSTRPSPPSSRPPGI